MEHRDPLAGTNWSFFYDDRTFPPGTDSFLLSAFPRLKRELRVCDLGAGANLLGLLLLRREPTLAVTGVEVDEHTCRLAERNCVENGLENRLRILRADLRNWETLPPAGTFDLIICNPPYFAAGSGLSAVGTARQNAREELSCTLTDLCRTAARLLRWDGSFCLVHRPERLTDLCCEMRTAGLEPKRLRLVLKQQTAAAPSLLLLEGRRGGKPGLIWEPPLILQTSDGSPTAETDKIYYRNTEERL